MTIRTSSSLLRAWILGAVFTAALVVPASANVPLSSVSTDPFSGDGAAHATEVEPDTFADHGTTVTAFQVGRFFGGGASDIGFARSTDGGATWTSGMLPGLTVAVAPGSQYLRASDPSIAYDALHGTWIVSSLPIPASGVPPAVAFSVSTDDGVTWSAPTQMPSPPSNKVFDDKNWTVCDDTASSPFYGHCYTEFDNFGQGDLEYMSTSTDGGRTWSAPVSTAGNDKGIGGQPLVQADGTVIVPFESLNGKMAAFRSTDGGASWQRAVTIAAIRFHGVAGGLRTSPLPSAEIAGDGTLYVAWEDCRFEKKCTANDIVISHSADGASWSAPAKVPDTANLHADHFVPGLAVDRATAGAGTHLALSYYFYPDAASATDMQVAFVTSPDGGAHWSDPTTLAGPMQLADLAPTSQGPMVGDYMSTSFLPDGTATSVFAVGAAHGGSVFAEAMFSPATSLPVDLSASNPSTSAAVAQTTGAGTGQTHQALRDD
jgi:hypothetical protein